MTIDDLKNAKLSATTQGYLAIYLQLDQIFGDLSDATGIEYSPRDVDDVNRACYDAVSNAQAEVMKLVVDSMKNHLFVLSNSTEI